MQSNLRARHWQLLHGGFCLDKGHTCFNGCALLARWPTKKVKVPEELLDLGRVMMHHTHRPGARDIVIANAHLNPSDAAEATRFIRDLIVHLYLCGEDFLIMRDFKLEPSQEPPASL